MSQASGFWSYVHADDEAEGGRITQLARDICAQYEVHTGESIALFLDKDVLEWGQKWRERIDETLVATAFFVPVLTPRFFRSPECRRELQLFARAATALGVRELIMPILYVEVPTLSGESTEDDLAILTRSFQWEDWRDLRFLERSSEVYRRAVDRLARRLVDANRQAEMAGGARVAVSQEAATVDNTPGLLDRLAQAEEALPAWSATLDVITNLILEVNTAVVEATDEMHRADAQGRGFALRVASARRLAARLSPLAERIVHASTEYTTQLHEVDSGFHTLIEIGTAAAKEDPEVVEGVRTFFDGVRGLERAARDGLDSTQSMIDALEPVERMSRDLRPPLRRLRHGLTALLEARAVAAEWVAAINASGL